MRKIITTTFVTLDGVMQAPGGLDEDTSGGFAHGGWTYRYWEEDQGGAMGAIMNGIMALPFELLLGRRTYNIFAAFWPTAKNDPEVAKPFNSTRKFVVSHNKIPLPWKNSFLVSGDVVAQLKKLKEEDAPDLWVHGSGNLIQTLLANHLVDRMLVWTFPVTVGGGKRLFAEGTRAERLKVVDSKVASNGVIIATYVPVGELKTGTIGE